MKNTIYYPTLFPVCLFNLFTACTPENEQVLPPYSPLIYSDDFEWFTKGNLELDNWTHDVKKGTKPWKYETRNNNSYLYFTGYAPSGTLKETANESWIISKELNIDEAKLKRLTFISTQGYVSDFTNNDLELYIIHHINHISADTVRIEYTKPVLGQTNFKWINSGIVSLASFSGIIKIAFRGTGSGTDPNADGTYEVDNIKVF